MEDLSVHCGHQPLARRGGYVLVNVFRWGTGGYVLVGLFIVGYNLIMFYNSDKVALMVSGADGRPA